MNRAEMRDWLRRMLGIQPPIDTTLENAMPGDAPSWQPDPSNPRLNQAITDACASINRRLRLTDRQTLVEVDVSAQTDDGPFWTDLGNTLDTQAAGSITSVASVNWVCGDERTSLTPTSLDELRRSGYQPDNTAVGTPTHYMVERYRLGVWPGPDTAGTLELRVTTGLLAPASDGDGFPQLPDEYAQCILYAALVDVAKGMSEDAAMAQVATTYEGERKRGEDELARWVAASSGTEWQPSFIGVRHVRPSTYYRRR